MSGDFLNESANNYFIHHSYFSSCLHLSYKRQQKKEQEKLIMAGMPKTITSP
jgi:hypothetical protein